MEAQPLTSPETTGASALLNKDVVACEAPPPRLGRASRLALPLAIAVGCGGAVALAFGARSGISQKHHVDSATDIMSAASETKAGHAKEQQHHHHDHQEQHHKFGKKKKNAKKTKRKGSFLVLGDWGFDENVHGTFKNNTCQKLIADQMLTTFKELGDVKFVINVGDSFYPAGVKDKEDPQWDKKWRNVYSPELRSVPWYSVYGNHDYQGDPCACATDPNECAQVNYDKSDLNYFYMPGLNYHIEHPELDLEVVAMDLNQYMWGWNTSWKDTFILEETQEIPDENKSGPVPDDCKYTNCQGECEGNLKWRAQEGLNLFYERKEASEAKNMIVFSHYPTDYLWNETKFLGALSDATKHHIEYFGGHRHNVDQESTWQIKPNSNWLVGGGGGWGCEGSYYMWPPQQGFVVGNIDGDGVMSTYKVLVDHTVCCPGQTKPEWPPMFKY
jgi:hypothetical protein